MKFAKFDKIVEFQEIFSNKENFQMFKFSDYVQ